ncbi:hypothetical protein GKIL_3855 [Gloeobacter kilaueensis JS1]|uniref:HNH nuclease domain-containing protein n=2 Tax=Gloeobacter TaxID=33071 RepID=U5QMF5_GLOK1|nr:hypothetical protein GKIL_3855 [Gloeobacter kilaueensis JS1]
MNEQGLDLSKPKPQGVTLEPFWQDCLEELHSAYDGICAYVCVYIERVTGTPSADHFVPKSGDLNKAYEWSNYRLACQRMNARKNKYDDVLDPFSLGSNTFELELFSGRIYPSRSLSSADVQAAQATILRLKLDDPDCRELRTRYFNAYINDEISVKWLQKHSPFVWQEAQRQNLL